MTSAIGGGTRCRFIGNVGEGCEVVELDAGHMCMISQPEALAEILDGIAARS
jgi:hypothetical protein